MCKSNGGFSLSTVEAKIALLVTWQESYSGVREVLQEMGFMIVTPMTVMIDNPAAIKNLEGESSPVKASTST